MWWWIEYSGVVKLWEEWQRWSSFWIVLLEWQFESHEALSHYQWPSMPSMVSPHDASQTASWLSLLRRVLSNHDNIAHSWAPIVLKLIDGSLFPNIPDVHLPPESISFCLGEIVRQSIVSQHFSWLTITHGAGIRLEEGELSSVEASFANVYLVESDWFHNQDCISLPASGRGIWSARGRFRRKQTSCEYVMKIKGVILRCMTMIHCLSSGRKTEEKSGLWLRIMKGGLHLKITSPSF